MVARLVDTAPEPLGWEGPVSAVPPMLVRGDIAPRAATRAAAPTTWTCSWTAFRHADAPPPAPTGSPTTAWPWNGMPPTRSPRKTRNRAMLAARAGLTPTAREAHQELRHLVPQHAGAAAASPPARSRHHPAGPSGITVRRRATCGGCANSPRRSTAPATPSCTGHPRGLGHRSVVAAVRKKRRNRGGDGNRPVRGRSRRAGRGLAGHGVVGVPHPPGADAPHPRPTVRGRAPRALPQSLARMRPPARTTAVAPRLWTTPRCLPTSSRLSASSGKPSAGRHPSPITGSVSGRASMTDRWWGTPEHPWSRKPEHISAHAAARPLPGLAASVHRRVRADPRMRPVHRPSRGVPRRNQSQPGRPSTAAARGRSTGPGPHHRQLRSPPTRKPKSSKPTGGLPKARHPRLPVAVLHPRRLPLRP